MLRDGSVAVEATWCGVESEGDHDERCEVLHRTLRRIVRARGALDAQEAEALREADRLRLWRHYGYSSLLEYMEMELGYTPRAALERLRVAKALVELPAIAEAMAQGDLSFSAGRELTRVATPETEQQWLDAASDRNLRQVEELVSGHKPGDTPDDPVDPKLRKRRLRYDDIADETVALVREARQILERELGDRLDDDTFMRSLARMVLDGARSPGRTHAPYQIAVTVCAQCKRGWQDGGGITVEMAPDKLESALCDATHIGSVEEAPPAACGADAEGGMRSLAYNAGTSTSSAIAPTSRLDASASGTGAPTSSAIAPTSRLDASASGTGAPTSDAIAPKSRLDASASGTGTPTSGAIAPTSRLDASASHARAPTTGAIAPTSTLQALACYADTPATGAIAPTSRLDALASNARTPTSGAIAPTSKLDAQASSAGTSTSAVAVGATARTSGGERGSSTIVRTPARPQCVLSPHPAPRAKSDIPPALRRKVKARDHGRCRVPWCRSSRNVDCHHLRPVSQGGEHTLDNIISLCESHHLAHHAGSLIIEGTAANVTFTRRAHDSFTRAERIVETRLALETLGFAKHEVAAAVEKTRTHVGTAELTVEQWIKIALTYCPKPLAR